MLNSFNNVICPGNSYNVKILQIEQNLGKRNEYDHTFFLRNYFICQPFPQRIFLL